MPVSLIESKLSDNAFRVYAYLRYLGFRAGHFQIRYLSMARLLGKSQPTLYRAVAELKSAGLLTKTDEGWVIHETRSPKTLRSSKAGVRQEDEEQSNSG